MISSFIRTKTNMRNINIERLSRKRCHLGYDIKVNQYQIWKPFGLIQTDIIEVSYQFIPHDYKLHIEDISSLTFFRYIKSISHNNHSNDIYREVRTNTIRITIIVSISKVHQKKCKVQLSYKVCSYPNTFSRK